VDSPLSRHFSTIANRCCSVSFLLIKNPPKSKVRRAVSQTIFNSKTGYLWGAYETLTPVMIFGAIFILSGVVLLAASRPCVNLQRNKTCSFNW